MKKQILIPTLITSILFSCPVSKSTAQIDTLQKETKVEKFTLNKSKLDSLFAAFEENDKFMGSITLSQNGKTIYTNAIGYDDIESQKKSTIDTRYRIGSISKMFTSSLIFIAVEENKIKLDQSIKTFFPTIKNADKITIGNLLNHRSGIHNFTADKSYFNYYMKPKTRNEMIEIISKFKSDFEPDSKSSYSNSNYVLLSIILEKAYNSSFKSLLNDKICVPINLKNTYFGSKTNLNNKECYSYRFLTKWTKETETDMSIPLGAGSVVSTTGDLNKFVESLFTGKIISKKSLSKMITFKDGYGMGIFKSPFYNRKSFGHTGSIDGFSSSLSYFPEEKVSVSLCSNGLNYSNIKIIIGALSCYFNEPFKVPTFKTFEIKESELDQYLGTYSTKEMPMKFIITKNKNVLVAQGTGQEKAKLEYKGNHKFSFEQVGAIFIFNPKSNQVILKQGGREFVFIKE